MAAAVSSSSARVPAPGTARWVESGVLVASPPHVQTIASVRAFYDEIRAALRGTTGPFVLVSDARHLTSMPDAVARREHAHQSDEISKEFPGRCVLSVTIVEGAVIRATITAVLWIVGDKARPHQVVGTMDDALHAARAKL